MMSMRTQKKTKCITASVCRRRGHEAGSLTAPSRPLRGLSSCSDRDNILLKQIDRLGMKESMPIIIPKSKKQAITRNLFHSKPIRKSTGKRPAEKSSGFYENDSPAVKRLKESMLCEVSVPFCESPAARRKILETIDDVVCGRDSITDQQIMAALDADPAFSEISDAELNKSKTFGYIKVEKACPLACKMAREYVERSVYLSKEYKESYLMQYKDWIDKFGNYQHDAWTKEGKVLEEEADFRNVINLMDVRQTDVE
ncbi:hypothetical protein WR25_04725 [Diploscapter pachys]|uniref:Uncharacterized protein n=1 Tax=Diploscapter pachys TaxID=2018661 RepID=A0A2A2L685_9BILA|nr:hypothetical protein WR25_04725 [Diploscapter pachys]